MPFRSTYRKQNGILVPYNSTSGIVNPDGASLSALLHGDDTHGATTFRDEVGNSWSIANGSPSISTSQSKFGGSSITMPAGTPSRLSAASSARFGFGSGAYTIGGWFYHVLGAATNVMVDTRTGSNTGVAVYLTSSRQLAVASNTASMVASSSSIYPFNTWMHFEVVRTGTTIYGFLNGVPVITVTDSRTYASASQCYLGWDYAASANQYFSGFLDSVYIYKGLALRTSADGFTPPTLPPRL